MKTYNTCIIIIIKINKLLIIDHLVCSNYFLYNITIIWLYTNVLSCAINIIDRLNNDIIRITQSQRLKWRFKSCSWSWACMGGKEREQMKSREELYCYSGTATTIGTVIVLHTYLRKHLVVSQCCICAVWCTWWALRESYVVFSSDLCHKWPRCSIDAESLCSPSSRLRMSLCACMVDARIVDL